MTNLKYPVNSKVFTLLKQLIDTEDKIIRTKDWGDFKIRKNGKICLRIEEEVIRCTPIKKL